MPRYSKETILNMAFVCRVWFGTRQNAERGGSAGHIAIGQF